MKNFWLYFHTVRYLKIVQIFYQIKYRLFRQALPKRGVVPKREVKGQVIAFVEPPQTLFNSYTFCFLNQKGSLKEIGTFVIDLELHPEVVAKINLELKPEET